MVSMVVTGFFAQWKVRLGYLSYVLTFSLSKLSTDWIFNATLFLFEAARGSSWIVCCPFGSAMYFLMLTFVVTSTVCSLFFTFPVDRMLPVLSYPEHQQVMGQFRKDTFLFITCILPCLLLFVFSAFWCLISNLKRGVLAFACCCLWYKPFPLAIFFATFCDIWVFIHLILLLHIISIYWYNLPRPSHVDLSHLATDWILPLPVIYCVLVGLQPYSTRRTRGRLFLLAGILNLL